jgi:hypothetical protein
MIPFFVLLSDHLIQRGPSFKQPVDALIDASTGHVEFMNRFLLVAILCAQVGAAAIHILPSPQYAEELTHKIRLGQTIRLVVGPESAAADAKIEYATGMIQNGLKSSSTVVRSGEAAVQIHLWDYSRSRKPPVVLNFLDKQTLEDAANFGQDYVLKSPDPSTVWIAGASPQGVIWDRGLERTALIGQNKDDQRKGGGSNQAEIQHLALDADGAYERFLLPMKLYM